MQTKRLSRRDFLRLSALTAAGAALAGCACPSGPVEPAVVTVETEKEVEVKVTTPAEEVVITQEVMVEAGEAEIRWFIGLGAGGNPEEVEKEEAFVADFNAEYVGKYQLVLDIVQNETAYDVLKTQIASGDVPDIVGPVGVRGLWSFEGAWLDLEPLIQSTGYDLSDFNPALIDFYKLGPQGQIGLPFAVYPSALWYNKDIFDEAELDYPPHEFGASYADGDDWTFDKLRELALFLTVDADGNDAAGGAADPENLVQFGYSPMWTDIRGQWTFFKAGSFVDASGNAVLPDVWREAAHWHYAAMWEDYFMPNDNYANSDLLAAGNTFGSGKVAMTPIHTWYTCCFQEVNWDVAAVPSYKGNITAKMHADTFGILQGSAQPAGAFTVLSLMLGRFAAQLLTVYGGLPARASLQDEALATMADMYPDADLDVFIEALNYPDNPNHESGMPNFLKASDRYNTFGALYQTTPDLDLDAELDKMIEDLQTVFDEV
jgi:multiple sugar transport system substrate-binding protein